MVEWSRRETERYVLRRLRWGAFVSWVIVAALAVAGFAAFSPEQVTETPSTMVAARVADGRGLTTGRILAGAVAMAAVDRTRFPTSSTKAPTTTSTPATDSTTGSPPARSGGPAPPSDTDSDAVTWPSGSQCLASWYGIGFAGKTTANGETFDPDTFTAALHGVAFGTIVEVTRTDTGAVTTVRVNDRGPYEWDGGWRRHPSRCVDLSEVAMRALGGIEDGVISVTISY